MRLSLSTMLAFVSATALCVLTFTVVGQPIWRIDYGAISQKTFPSDSIWEAILLAHSDEIVDGSRDPGVLNSEFEFGWELCVELFVSYPENHPNLPWDYDWIQNNNPGNHLGGPMQDTIRVSRATGRKHASDMIKNQLATMTKTELRSRFLTFNRRYIGLALGYALMVAFGISIAWKRGITKR